MKRLPILIVALLCAAALAQDAAPEPEYKSWDRERLEVAYQARCDELERVKKDLAEAKERIKQLEDAAAGQQQKAQAERRKVDSFHQIDQVVTWIPVELLPKSVGDKSAIDGLDKWLQKHAVSYQIDVLADNPKPVRVQRNGVTFVVYVKRENPDGHTIKSAVVRYAKSVYEIGLVVE